ncbi:lipid A deacylase LpxR family protein [Roseomonas terrae]|uniref:Lipid A deacylase LpxR family protein n=1 Tax=Neoroseomonas terrae TaxID=424799 RepID=A0ABS5EKS6_9PROT|nr:lipid A deacylase LpxR family protein [Neoroseomonas terrae]MBR0651630.1 lipid A deacylase LpxR family protein [Neoroseomonas terrae]
MVILHPKHAAAALAGLLLAAPAVAQQAVPGPEPRFGTFTLTYENDTFAGTDRYYTSGFQLAWRSAPYEPPSWIANGPGIVLPAGGTLRWGLAFGQSIFTPEDTALRNPDPNDRPYAGWLYGAISLSSTTPSSYGSIELQLGMVGRSALGEQVQNGVHDLLNIDRAYGWDYQLKDEPGINLVLTRQWRFNSEPIVDDVSVGFVPSLTASLGNVQTYASAGLMVRVGNELRSDFGPPRMRPSISGSSFYVPERPWGWYVFGGFDVRGVAYDIFLDGNAWQDSRHVDKEYFIGEVSAGVAVFTPLGRLTFSYAARTREFQTQRETAQFGSVSLSVQF